MTEKLFRALFWDMCCALNLQGVSQFTDSNLYPHCSHSGFFINIPPTLQSRFPRFIISRGDVSGRLSSICPPIAAPMAEALTGALRAVIQCDLSWIEDHGLICEITGQGWFRMWRG